MEAKKIRDKEIAPRNRRPNLRPGEIPTCKWCNVHLDSTNWTHWPAWSQNLRACTQYGCRTCLAKRQRLHRWTWLYRSVGAANAKTGGLVGKVTISGMRAKWTGKCHWCDCALVTSGGSRQMLPNGAILEHVVPLRDGGRNEDHNAVWACSDCNMSKWQSGANAWMDKMVRVLRKHRPAAVALYSLPACEIPDCLPVEL